MQGRAGVDRVTGGVDRRSTGRASAVLPGGRSQLGFTLVEVLLCVALVGIVVLGLAAALLTLVRSNATTSESQELQVALDSWAENVKAFDYLPCADATAYQAAYESWPEAWQPPPDLSVTMAIIEVEHWHKGPRQDGELVDGPGSFEATCPAGDDGPLDDGAQRLTLRVERGEDFRETLVVKAVR